MTLHWWMHWFWITTLIVVSLTRPISQMTMISSLPSITANSTKLELARIQQSYRIGKVIGMEPVGISDQVVATDSSRNFQLDYLTTTGSSMSEKSRTTMSLAENQTALEFIANKSMQMGKISSKKDNRITWIQAFNKSSKTKYEEKTSSVFPGDITFEDFMTVMSLRESTEEPWSKSLKFDPNAIRRNQPSRNRSSDDFVLGKQIIDLNDVDTATSIFDVALGDSARLGRVRETFMSEFQRKQLSNKNTEIKEEMIKESIETSANAIEIATITGSCLAIIILLSTVGSLGFIIYRRKYLNPPQTLNSDKCSNPDSSGYIDDSTIRDNSEELYSLDNDSFLNSLEAMTIQNYWTDSVKHTKL